MDIWIPTIRLSIKSLLLHPLRSVLTVLGIFIGVASVIWLLAMGEGIGRAAQEQIASLGAQNIIVRTIKPSSDELEDGGYGLTRNDYLRLIATIPTISKAIPIRELRQEFRHRTRSFEGRLVGFAEVSIRPYAEGCRSSRVAYLEGWFVLADARNLGAGRALIGAAEDWGRAQGCSEFASDADPGNDLSRAAHRAVGFTDVGLVRCFRKDL